MLLDTHALLWWLTEDGRLSARARKAIIASRGSVLVSAATGWELATKHRLGKLPQGEHVVPVLSELLQREGFGTLAVSLAHALAAGNLPGHHRDPFDRLLIAQAKLEVLPIVSVDRVFADYDVGVIW